MAALILGTMTAVLVSACASSTASPAPPDDDIDIGRSIVYGQADGIDLELDACIPADRDAGPFPGVVLIHGGAFQEGSRSNMLSLCKQLASDGIAAFPIDYRLLPASYPAPVDDAVAAVEWLSEPEQIERFDLSDRLSLLGSSAGGIIALSAAQALAETTTPVASVVSLSAAGDLTARALALGAPDPALEAVVLGYLGCESIEDCPQATAASPLSNVSLLPPTLLIHGSDELIPIEQATALNAAIEAAGVPVTLVVVDGGAHGLALLSDEILSEIEHFLVFGSSP